VVNHTFTFMGAGKISLPLLHNGDMGQQDKKDFIRGENTKRDGQANQGYGSDFCWSPWLA